MREYIGIPFSHQGKDWDGCDCWGLVLLFYENEFGIKLPSFHDDYETADKSRQIHSVTNREKDSWKRFDEPEYGDVILMRFRGFECHVGIYLENDKMLHIMRGTDSCIENLKDNKWRPRITGFYRYENCS